VEVLLTVIIVFAGLLALTRALASAAATLDEALAALQTEGLMRAKIAEAETRTLEGKGLALVDSGAFGAPARGYLWKAYSVPVPVIGEPDNPGLSEITVTVSRPPSPRAYVLSTYLRTPGRSGTRAGGRG